MMHEDFRITYSECSKDDWAEVDFHPDLEEMRTGLLANLPTWE